MRGAGSILAGMVAAALVVACGGDATPTVTGAVSTAAPSATPTREVTEASEVAGIATAESCEALHAAVLAHLDELATRARAALGGTTVIDAIEDMARPGSSGEFPEGLGFLAGLAPMDPYGGIAGDETEARYEELGCTPDGEYAALAGWFGVPIDADESALQAAAMPMVEGGADGAVALALARRLLEGDPDRDDAARIVVALEAAVAAQRVVHDRTGSYTEFVGDLVDAGMPATYDDVTSDVFVMVFEADADAYCMTAAGDRGVGYVESHDHTPVVESRTEPGQACAATFTDLD